MTELEKAALDYVGSGYEPNIGWRGSSPSRNDLFQCESCKAEHEDWSKIEHKDGCAALALINAVRNAA